MNNSKRLETVVRNIPDFTEAHSTRLAFEEMAQTTPALAEMLLEQLEEKQRSVETKDIQQDIDTQATIESFLTHKADGGAAQGYLDGLRRRLKSFARQYPKLPTDSEEIRVYLRHFGTTDVPTRQDQWKTLSMLYKFAVVTHGVSNPIISIDKPRFKKRPGQRLSRDQAKIFLSVVNTDLEWGLVTCYFGLRLRRVEAERLLCGDIKSDYIIVRGKERTEELPLLPVFRDKLLILHTNQDPGDPLFSIKADTMAYHIDRIFKRSGIEGVRGSPHTLRNSAGALWSTFGGDWTSNRQLLRHSATTITDHYSNSTIDELLLKDQRHNPMLNLMRELNQAPDCDCQDTSSAQQS